jgi:hypothetical protein
MTSWTIWPAGVIELIMPAVWPQASPFFDFTFTTGLFRQFETNPHRLQREAW